MYSIGTSTQLCNDLYEKGSLKSGDIYIYTQTIQSAKTISGADCGSDHELLIDKFGLKLKKVQKTTRPFRYDLNQIPYDYTVEVRNRFMGLDLIDAAATSLQSGPTLCDPTEGSPPGSAAPGILQARTLAWVATSFSNV